MCNTINHVGYCTKITFRIYISVYLRLTVRRVHQLSLCLLASKEVKVSREQLVEQRGLDQGEGHLLILTALPHGHTNGEAASGLPSSVWCVQFMQFRGDEWVCLWCMCVMGEKYKF